MRSIWLFGIGLAAMVVKLLFVPLALTAWALVTPPGSWVRKCPPPLPPEELARHVSSIFEGILLDKWTELQPGRWLLRVDHYRFRVVRGWGEMTEHEVELRHGDEEGYSYQAFDVGHRYLVFATSDDMPAQLFASSCVPRVEGAAIPAISAKLGPPAVTFEEADIVTVPYWLQASRVWRMYVAAVDQVASPIVDGLAHLTGQED